MTSGCGDLIWTGSVGAVSKASLAAKGSAGGMVVYKAEADLPDHQASCQRTLEVASPLQPSIEVDLLK